MRFVFTEWYNRSVKSGCVAEDFTPEVCYNAGKLIEKINRLGFKPSRFFSSCLRSRQSQIRIYKAKGITDESKIPFGSAHLTGEGVDIADDGELQRWLKANVKKLKELGLYVEDFSATPTWVHIQDRAPKSGNTFFKP